jgi:hypothetical protein
MKKVESLNRATVDHYNDSQIINKLASDEIAYF